jgi:hypothetical protein
MRSTYWSASTWFTNPLVADRNLKKIAWLAFAGFLAGGLAFLVMFELIG